MFDFRNHREKVMFSLRAKAEWNQQIMTETSVRGTGREELAQSARQLLGLTFVNTET